MMKIVSILLQVVFVSLGALGGLWLKSGGDNAAAESAEEHGGADAAQGDEHGEKDKKDKKKKKKDDHGKSSDGHGGDDGHGSDGSSDDFSFMKFGRQFIVPVIRSDDVNALVVLDINLELDPSAAERAYSREPKIRDAILSTLLTLSNEGAFEDKLLDEQNMAHVRARLLASAQSILGDDAIDILILSMARQDF